MIADFSVVKHPLGGPDVVIVQGGQRERREVAQATVGQHLEGLPHGGQVVFRQVARVGTRVGQGFVPLVQALRQGQRGLGRKAKTPVGLTLQRGQVKQAGGGLGGGFAFFADRGGLTAGGVGDRLGFGLRPHAVGFLFGVVLVFLVLGVDPLARVFTGGDLEIGVNFPVVAADEFANLLLALDHHTQRGGLHPAHGGQEKAAVTGVEGGESAGAVDAHQPIGLGAAAGGVGQALHLLFGAQGVKAIADGLRGHGLQPQALDRLVDGFLATCILLDQSEDQFPLTARVTGIDQCRDVLALDLLDHRVQAGLGFVHGLEVKKGRNHRQMGKAPLATFHVVSLGRLNFHQVTHRAGHDIAVIFEMVFMLFKFAGHRGERPDDVLRNRWLLSDDQCLAHAYAFLVSCQMYQLSGALTARTPTCFYNLLLARARARVYVFNLTEFSRGFKIPCFPSPNSDPPLRRPWQGSVCRGAHCRG